MTEQTAEQQTAPPPSPELADNPDIVRVLAEGTNPASDAYSTRRDELAGSKSNTFLFQKTTPVANANVMKVRHLVCGGNTYANLDQTEAYCEHCNMKGPIFIPEKPEDTAKLMEEIAGEEIPDETGIGASGEPLPPDPSAPPPPQVKPLGTRKRLPSLDQVLRERKETMTGQGQGTGNIADVELVKPPAGDVEGMEKEGKDGPQQG